MIQNRLEPAGLQLLYTFFLLFYAGCSLSPPSQLKAECCIQSEERLNRCSNKVWPSCKWGWRSEIDKNLWKHSELC